MAGDSDGKSNVAAHRRPRICYVIGVILFGYLGAAVFLIILVHVNLIGWLNDFQLLRSHVMCGGFGMLGASIAAMRKYYQALITETSDQRNSKSPAKVIWDFGWSFYYITRPMLGGILGALSYTLSFVGFNALAGASSHEISMDGKFLLYGFALVSGFSVSQVLDRLNATAKQFFQHRPGVKNM